MGCGICSGTIPSADVELICKHWRGPATVLPNCPCFPCLPDQLGHHARVFDTPWDSSLLHRGVNIGVLQEKSHEAIGNDLKKDLALDTQEGDCSELLDVLCVFILGNSYSLWVLPLLRYLPSFPDRSEDLPKTLQQTGTLFEDLVQNSTWAWC